ncbi:hypothetical protein SAMN04488542_103151 [Fontibacillus panacisegetis]|uniref:Mannosyl-glycoprotein endo-beta-N-acetylglucosaminidase n=1 Tax=Fontibacillus panacisegetis TaxID=670482 RepID=A0A1G7GQ13_9BACL|nr:glucosaminidase domain-containing protein [Fontibacillus panacisegetis]SDE90258.1 hypothetical protein SAMN04488542_103151 [Fontibacillus panacisegetis]
MHEYVLSNGEAVRLKKYIELKHRDLEAEQRLAIWSDAAHRIIEGRLPSFPDEVKKRMRAELLNKGKDTLVIHQDDALRECMALDLDQEELMVPLAVWVSSRAAVPVEENVLRDTLHKWSQHPSAAVSLTALADELSQAPEASEIPPDLVETVTSEEAAVTAEITAAAETADIFAPQEKIGWFTFNRRTALSISIGCIAVAAVLMFAIFYPHEQEEAIIMEEFHPAALEMAQLRIKERAMLRFVDGIPAELRYVDVNKKRLQAFLQERNSMLADDPYFSSIIESGRLYDIHPLLLFAITGQEQGFVPKSHKDAKKIANNPFNVFGSWESYNSSIEASSNIAAKTVKNISNRRPGASHPIQWLNQTYAEDPNWWIGVTWFFNTMLQEIEGTSFEWVE